MFSSRLVAYLLAPLQSARPAARSSRRRPPLRIELLEDRTLPSVSFTAGPLAVPLNRTDVPLGPIGSNFEEPALSINDRLDPGNIAVSSHSGLLVTRDAFATPSLIGRYPTNSGGDTWTDFDAQGNLYWSNLDTTLSTGRSKRLTVDVTQVNQANLIRGAAFGNAVVVNRPDAGFSDDREAIAADSNPASPYANYIYAVWTRFDNTDFSSTVLVSRSNNQGAAGSWSTPFQVSSDVQGRVQQVGISVAANGDVYVAWHAQVSSEDDTGMDDTGNDPDGTSGAISVARSTDGGLHFWPCAVPFLQGQADVTWNDQQEAQSNIPGTKFWMRGCGTPYVLADPARPGNVYVITADDPDNNHGSGDDANVVLARSYDNGETWARSTLSAGPVNVAGTINNSFQLFATAAIDRFGNIVVAWYDNRRGLKNNGADTIAGTSDDNYLLDVYATYSTDGGLTWATEFRVNDRSIDPDLNPVVRDDGSYRIGEYFGLDIFAGTAYVAWTGNDVDVGRQQVLFDSFAIPGALTVTGDDGGIATDDTIIVRRMVANPDYVEVLVNGQRQYAGLASSVTSLTINGLAGNDSLTVDMTSGAIAGSGGLTFNGGKGANAFSIIGTPFSETYTVTTTRVRKEGWLFNMNFSGVQTLTLDTAAGTDTINVNSTSTDMNLFTINAGADNDTINLSNDVHLLDNVQGNLTINGGTGALDTLNLYDQANPANALWHSYAVFDNRISRLGSASVGYSSLDKVLLKAGAGADTINIRSTAQGIPVTVYAGAGADILNVGTTGNAMDILNGTAGNTLDNLLADVTLFGEDGNDTMSIFDHATAAGKTYTLSSTIVQRSTAARVIYATMNSVVLKASAGDDTLSITAGQNFAGAIDGGTGSDTLDYSAYVAAVSVDLGLGSATGVAAGAAASISNIESAKGGSAGDTLIGNAADNVLVGNAGNDVLSGGGGRDLLIGGAGADTVTGGADDDIVIGSRTLYDANDAALRAIMAEWTRTDLAGTAQEQYNLRTDHLLHGTGLTGGTVLDRTRLLDDAVADTLTGSAGLDWFFLFGPDAISDRELGELVG